MHIRMQVVSGMLLLPDLICLEDARPEILIVHAVIPSCDYRIQTHHPVCFQQIT